MSSISIIIPTYQHAQTLGTCLESIFLQTRPPDEVIVVDDGSRDETPSILDRYADRIRVIRQENQGAPRARNNGFAASHGSSVLFCDADVIMQKEMLEVLSNTLDEHPEASFAYGNFYWGKKHFRSFPFDAKKLKQMNYIHTSALIRREDFPGFDPALKRFQDWDLWLTMSEKGKRGVFVDRDLYRIELPRRKGISTWIPSFVYRFPWEKIGWMPKQIKSYQEAQEIIRNKHHLL